MKLEAELCILKDTFVTQNKQSEAHMNRLASRIEEMTKQFTSSMNKMAAPQLNGQSQPRTDQPLIWEVYPPSGRILTPPSQDVFTAARKGI